MNLYSVGQPLIFTIPLSPCRYFSRPQVAAPLSTRAEAGSQLLAQGTTTLDEYIL